uniref:Large ribosomal subunit protein bL32c n=1 Tax=Cryptogramma acrostichoides TaxID=414624 RepID=A0A3G5CSF1_9MONI|nr:ribosomal protein L32 [Cryptogramma acrostichoides]AYW15775.1 ribosomal protein L32 [Cryptogramma acrostichoides]
MAVPKKRTSGSKKRIRNRTWKIKSVEKAKKSFSLAQSVLSGRSKSFYYITERKSFRTKQRYLCNLQVPYLKN